jgi:phosphatidylserine/phosphatidylglycerophosphate/cardiolipin synthase-like enzyme
MFVADNALAFSGGRNLGDAYFLQSAEANFVDMDMLVAGPAVQALSRSFDRYWNSALAYPVKALVPDAPPPKAPTSAASSPELDTPPPAEPTFGLPPNAAAREIAPGARLRLQWAPARLLADDPAKIEAQGNVPADQQMFDDVAALLHSARREVLIISPYLVPGERGMALFRELRARGVKLRIITSSLAATDAPAVYLGYARYRIPMLKEGVELYELRPRIDEHEHRELGGFGQSQARLHAKAMAVDGQYLLIGSMNLDPRSINLNSEIGLLAHSAPLAAQVDQLFDAVTRDSSFQLRLGTGGTLEWVRRLPDGGEDLRFTEPDSSWLKRLGWSLLAPLAPEEML